MLNRIFNSSIRFKLLSAAEFQALREGAEVIEKDGHGEKVLLLPDGTYLKLFRRKRLISSALFYPYAKRFVINAEKLESLGIRCPKIIATYKLSTPRRDIVHYAPVPGKTIRSLICSGELSAETLNLVREFIKNLHSKGLYFRSIHSGNIIVLKNQLGLIDISDLIIKKPPLTQKLSEKNLMIFEKDLKN